MTTFILLTGFSMRIKQTFRDPASRSSEKISPGSFRYGKIYCFVFIVHIYIIMNKWDYQQM